MRVLRLLLSLLPAAFRREYQAELLTTAQDQWREAKPSLGPVGRVRFWWRQWFAAVRVGAGLWREERGGLLDTQRHRSKRGWGGLSQDVRYATRSLLAQPGFTLVAVLSFGLGIGATTAMFSAVHSVLFAPLPYDEADDIVVVTQTDGGEDAFGDGVSAANMRDIAAAARTLSHASIAEAHGLRLIEEGRAHSLRSWLVSEGFLEAIGARVQLGRAFLPDEFVAGNDQVVLLSHEAWQTRFGGDAGILGRSLVLDGDAYEVVGVLPPNFRYPSAAEIWGPRPHQPFDEGRRGSAGLDGIARLSPGATLAYAEAELDRIASDLAAIHPGVDANLGFRAVPLRRHLFGDVESPLYLLLGAVGLVLLIAAANVAGLHLARGAGRAREYALRCALGAGSVRIVQLVVLESVLLAGAGGAVGIGLAYLGVHSVRVLGPDHVPRIDEMRIDGIVLTFAVVAVVASALVASLVPAMKASTMQLNATLAVGSRGTKGPRIGKARDRLVVGEIAAAVILTIGAGLLVRSFDRLMDNELGFDPNGRLVAQVWAYDDNHGARLEYFDESVEAIGAVPGVELVGLTTAVPLADDRSLLARSSTVRVTLDGTAVTRGGDPVAGLVAVDGNYSAAMGIALRNGRNFATRDHAASPPVAMVNEAFVRRNFPDRDPVGQRITLQWRTNESREIVGVLADVRRRGHESEPRPEIYVPLSQEPSNGLTFVVKTATDPANLIATVREAMWATDPGQAVWAATSMTDLLSGWSRQRRFNTALLAAFAGLALALAGIGVYGLMSFSVAQRVNELGIRRALGGQTRDIFGFVLRHGIVLAVAGAAVGLTGAVALTGLLSGMLFDIDPVDPVTFGSVSLFVVAVAVFAAFVPAVRATRVDPMVALRME